MSTSSLPALAEEQLTLARATGSGRSARTIHGGADTPLRQTLVAQDRSWPGETGDLLVIPDPRHALHADEDSVVLLTVARG
ncbi:LuxR family transcriptional regulator [Micromonospora sp. NPDC047740]|uniref:LuxR family transcriptional regulator n=1 Tax=Micromonospora sp. NPDC047740 TaxID=3364254 RepID=UPI003722DE10